jgi:putative SOS response-associated peptidase YedK
MLYCEKERDAETPPMCGRYNLTVPPEVLARVFCVPAVPPLTPRYNIAPTQTVPIVRQATDREMVLAR